jgi:proteasome accessory factor A
MQQRIFGLETEYGLSVTRDDGSQVDTHVAARVIADHHGQVAVNSFLANGARLYADCGHVEYATPECVSPHDVVVADRAGERVVFDAGVRGACQFALGSDVTLSVSQYKNNVDTFGITYGCHENYLADARLDLERLGPFLLTRGIWAGAGQWDGFAGEFRSSQRAGMLVNMLGTSSTRDRPLIHMRDEPHADRSRFQRVHVLAGDANFSDVIAETKLAACALVLRCLEEDPSRWRDFQPVSVVDAHVAVSRALDGRGRYHRAAGGTVSALLVQRWHHARAAKLLDRSGGEAWEFLGLDRWGSLLDALEADGPAGLVGVADWATKLDLLEQVASRGHGMADAKVAYTNLRWHDVDVSVGFARRLESQGRFERTTSDDEVTKAAVVPLSVTRAQTRGGFIAWASQACPSAAVNWDRCSVNYGTSFLLDDPFDVPTERFRAWLEAIEVKVVSDPRLLDAEPPMSDTAASWLPMTPG